MEFHLADFSHILVVLVAGMPAFSLIQKYITNRKLICLLELKMHYAFWVYIFMNYFVSTQKSGTSGTDFTPTLMPTKKSTTGRASKSSLRTTTPSMGTTTKTTETIKKSLKTIHWVLIGLMIVLFAVVGVILWRCKILQRTQRGKNIMLFICLLVLPLVCLSFYLSIRLPVCLSIYILLICITLFCTVFSTISKTIFESVQF